MAMESERENRDEIAEGVRRNYGKERRSDGI